MIPQMPFSQARFTIGVRLMGGKGILHGFTSTILLQKLSPLNKKKKTQLMQREIFTYFS